MSTVSDRHRGPLRCRALLSLTVLILAADGLARPLPARSDARLPPVAVAAGSDTTDDREPGARERADASRWETGAFALGAAFVLDRPVRSGVLGARGATLDHVAEPAEWLGDWRASLPFMTAGALAIGGMTGGERGLRRGVAILGGIAAGSLANELLNQSFGRTRPDRNAGMLSFRPFTGHASLPSGHTAFVFGLAGGIDAAVEHPLPVVAAYGAAALTGLSRVYHDKHWLSDVLVGAGVGALVSRTVTGELIGLLRESGEERDRGTGQRAPVLRPTISPERLGLEIRF